MLRSSQPQRDVRGLHRLGDDARSSAAERVEGDLVAQARAEGLERARGVVAAAVEAPVDDAWMRARAGRKSAATASVEPATARPEPAVSRQRRAAAAARCRGRSAPSVAVSAP